jgi:DNA replication protein DnaC
MAESTCPICDGTGYVVVERNGLSGAKRCTCAAVARPDTILKSANIPPAYEHATFGNFEARPPSNLASALSKVRNFATGFPTGEKPGLLLVGDTGSGKTHLAVAALKRILEKGIEGQFFDYQNLLDKIRSGYNASSGSSDREAYRSAMEADVLLLDDLGSHRVTEWVEDTVTSIITYRCNHKKPLIATTNLEMDDNMPSGGGAPVSRKSIGEVIGLRARSRLFEMCTIVRLRGIADYRERNSRQELG